MSYLLVDGSLVHRVDDAAIELRLHNLRQELQMQKQMRDRCVARIAVIKAEFIEIKALDATLDTTDL